MRELTSLLSVLVVAGSGCASAPTDPATPLGDATEPRAAPASEVVRTALDSGVECRNERGTGSHIVRRQCYSRAELDRVTEASKDWLRSGGVQGAPLVVRDHADPRVDD